MKFPLTKQDLCKILVNPFYCGLIANKLLEGRIIQGVHPALISKDLFLQVNNVIQAKSNYGVPHKKEDNNIPLKVFIKCDNCNEPYTGYIVKAKNLYYYKCRKKGCACNMSAIKMHTLFEEFLSKFSINEALVPLVQQQLMYLYDELNKGGEQTVINLKYLLTEINKKMDNIEEKHYALNEMSKEVFQKFSNKYHDEKKQILQEMEKNSGSISNHEECINSVLEFASKLNTAWRSSDISSKEKIQNLIFPEGIYYNKQNHSFRTTKINSVFSCIAQLQSIVGDKKKRTKQVKTDLSAKVGVDGTNRRPLPTFQVGML
jgi:site-specific DNA recombinase